MLKKNSLLQKYQPKAQGLAAKVGSQTIGLGAETLDARPALGEYAGHTVVLGIRLLPGAARFGKTAAGYSWHQQVARAFDVLRRQAIDRGGELLRAASARYPMSVRYCIPGKRISAIAA